MSLWKDEWSDAARTEYARAVEHYLTIDPRLADDLEAIVDNAIELLLRHPQAGPVYLRGTRRKVLRRFPFCLVYLVDEQAQRIRIVALVNQRREPGYWIPRPG